MPARPQGVFAPVATIFDADGEIHGPAFRENLAVYATSSLDGVVLLGSNGEFATLSTDERKRVIALGTEAIGGRKTVMAGTGAESTRDTIAMTRFAAEAGVDYALVVTPHYYKTRYDAAAY
jgi:4-hydroxy-2-oxoglutarate aldolase